VDALSQSDVVKLHVSIGKVINGLDGLIAVAAWRSLTSFANGTRAKRWHESWSMITARPAESGFPVHWIKHPKINVKAWLLVAAAVLLPILFALSLPRSEPSHAIADDPQIRTFGEKIPRAERNGG
jgi:hypothetical protein